jgi:hypothetical protein
MSMSAEQIAEEGGEDWEELTPEEQSKARVRSEYEQLAAQSEHFGWRLRLLDAGDYHVILVRMPSPGSRVFVLKLVCDDYCQIPPLTGFISPELFDTADEATPFDACSYPQGADIRTDPGQLPVLCIKGHRGYYAGGWHSGWSIPPGHEHTLYQHVVNVRNALLDRWV